MYIHIGNWNRIRKSKSVVTILNMLNIGTKTIITERKAVKFICFEK